jgi:hypothetical protein
MPNWCYNNLTIRHADPAMLDRVVKAKEALLTEFFPCPAELHDHDSPEKDAVRAAYFQEKYGATDWYDWQVSNWGTKWDFPLERVERTDPNTVECAFDSAWSPPITAYEKLCVMGFEITAHYYEPGMSFCGTWTGHYEGDEETGDVFTDDQYFELGEYNSDTVRDAVGVELDEMFSISENMAEWEAQNEE